jgi:hypothetical protein
MSEKEIKVRKEHFYLNLSFGYEISLTSDG